MVPRGIFEFLGLENAISSILGVVLSCFKRITEVRLPSRISLHYIKTLQQCMQGSKKNPFCNNKGHLLQHMIYAYIKYEIPEHL